MINRWRQFSLSSVFTMTDLYNIHITTDGTLTRLSVCSSLSSLLVQRDPEILDLLHRGQKLRARLPHTSGGVKSMG